MASKKARPRVLIYSHDSFGLGHLRRCRAIAHAMVGSVEDLTVLILSGSPIIGSFDFRARVDFVRVPGVIKLRNGEYTSLNLLLDTDQTMAMRESIMKHTADIFDPDILLVDKEPLGLRGEMRETIEMLKERGTRIILGLRDVMDDPDLLKAEWRRKKAMPALRDLYDDIWVYGLPQVHDPLEELDVPQSVRRKMVYTGYLERTVPQNLHDDGLPDGIEEPFVLVTPVAAAMAICSSTGCSRPMNANVRRPFRLSSCLARSCSPRSKPRSRNGSTSSSMSPPLPSTRILKP